jgi:catechol 2,3-dioxygenase-like lactoylglutathione lyase family enzyme
VGVAFDQVNLVVRDIDRTVAFYRLLGVEIEAPAGTEHVNVRFENGLGLEFDVVPFAAMWDSASSGATGGTAVIGFSCDSRLEVDELYARMIAGGAPGRQPPYDAFWGARYAMVEDPDENPVGLMSPIDPSRKVWPPSGPPPRGDAAPAGG